MRTSLARLILLASLSPLALTACGAAAPAESSPSPPACAGKVASNGKCEDATATTAPGGSASPGAKGDFADDALAGAPPPPPPDDAERKEDPALPPTRSAIIKTETESTEGGMPGGAEGAAMGAGKTGSDKGPGRGCQPNDPLCMFSRSGPK